MSFEIIKRKTYSSGPGSGTGPLSPSVPLLPNGLLSPDGLLSPNGPLSPDGRNSLSPSLSPPAQFSETCLSTQGPPVCARLTQCFRKTYGWLLPTATSRPSSSSSTTMNAVLTCPTSTHTHPCRSCCSLFSTTHPLSGTLPHPTATLTSCSFSFLGVCVSLILLIINLSHAPGGDVNVVDGDGDTPLYTVEDIKTAQFLVAQGAVVDRTNNEGVSVGPDMSYFSQDNTNLQLAHRALAS